MAGLPKKYARMGFKKGWRLFKASKSTVRRIVSKVRRSKSTPVKRAVGGQMARKRGSFRRRARSSGRSGGLSPMHVALFGLGYGAVRPTLYGFAGKTGMNPRLVLGVAGYLAMTKGSGMVKTLGLIALANEASAQGQASASPLLGAATGSGGGVVYL